MGMTMTQKILAAHAGLDKVEAGQLIEADLDLVLGNDITSPVAIKEMDKMKVNGVFDKDKIALVPDHFVPNKDIKSAEHCKCVREFAKKNEITNYFEVGEMGIEHCAVTGKRADGSGRRDYRCGFPYLYLRRSRRFFYGSGKYGYGGRYGNGESVVQSAGSHQI